MGIAGTEVVGAGVTAALRRAKAASDDGYVKTFCNQQLRLCE